MFAEGGAENRVLVNHHYWSFNYWLKQELCPRQTQEDVISFSAELVNTDKFFFQFCWIIIVYCCVLCQHLLKMMLNPETQRVCWWQVNVRFFFFFSWSCFSPAVTQACDSTLPIFKSRASWPSSHDRPDANRESDANVTPPQNVISHARLVPWHFWRENRECPWISWFKSNTILFSS